MKKNYVFKTVFTFLLCGLFSLSYAADWYISTTGSDTSGDGSIALPWASFSKAQDAAATGDIINVSGMIDMWSDPANTTFTALASGSSTTNKTGITIAKSLTIQGTSSSTDGFNGTSGENTTRFFQLTNAAYTLTLKNLKLANGAIKSTLTTLSYAGGAILLTNGNIMAENVVFDGNSVSGHSGITGAAISVSGANNLGSYFKNCMFSNNVADKAGAFYVQSWTAGTSTLPSIFQFEGCSFISNESKLGTGGSALFIRSASEYTTFNVINCTFSKNKVSHTGNGGTINLGGKGMRYLNVNIINCTVSENTCAGTSSNGAGLNYVNTTNNNIGNLYIKNSIIENNTTTSGVYSDLNLSAASPTTADGGSTTVPGYIKIENSFIGAHISDNTRVPTGNIVSSQVGYLTTNSTTNHLKAGLAPLNTTNNYHPLYLGSAAIGYGNSALLTPYSTKDQLGNIRIVGATNTAGSVETTPLATTTPDAPTALVATAGDGQVSVAFKSAATGGSLITNYKYSVNDGIYVTCEPAVTAGPIVIAGLTNDVPYTVKLKAVNAIGDSPESVASNSATPTVATRLNNELNNVITIFKNSNKQIVVNNASLKTGTITVCNALGQRIVCTTLNGASTTINKSLKSGVYMVLVSIDEKVNSTKIIL